MTIWRTPLPGSLRECDKADRSFPFVQAFRWIFGDSDPPTRLSKQKLRARKKFFESLQFTFAAQMEASMALWRWVGLMLLGTSYLNAQATDTTENNAGHVPVISGGIGYVQNVKGGVNTLEPQIVPVLLAPLGSHVLLESRVAFTGVFQRENGTSGPYKGKVFTSVEYAQVDWLANTHVMPTAGIYLVPFGLFNERIDPIWIRNLQDPPITASVGSGVSGTGDGAMLRGLLTQAPSYSIQYACYFSALSTIDKLEASRTTGGDASVYFPHAHLEAGSSYQRLLQDRHMNSVATYLSWQPPRTPLDVKAEYDYSLYGQGYWLEAAGWLDRVPAMPALLKRFEVVGRMQQVYPKNGGGHGLPIVDTNRFDAGLNFHFRDNLRLVSSYGRQFNRPVDVNIWNFGFTYRFTFPLWFGKGK
jgi:hypothetical protein